MAVDGRALSQIGRLSLKSKTDRTSSLETDKKSPPVEMEPRVLIATGPAGNVRLFLFYNLFKSHCYFSRILVKMKNIPVVAGNSEYQRADSSAFQGLDQQKYSHQYSLASGIYKKVFERIYCPLEDHRYSVIHPSQKLLNRPRQRVLKVR